MAQGPQLPRPVVRARAGLDADQAGRQPGEEHGDLAAPQPPAQDAVARGVGAVRPPSRPTATSASWKTT